MFIVVENAQQEAIDILKKYKLYDSLDEDVKKLLSDPKNNVLQEKSMIEKGKFKHVENILIGSNDIALHTAEETAKRFNMESIVLTNTIEGNVNDVSFSYAKFTKSICHILEKKISNKEDFVTEIAEQNIETLSISQEKLEQIFEILIETRKGKGVLLLAGGEPTVVVVGDGKGGRNEELALRFSLDWLSQIAEDPQLAIYSVIFLSAGTDGQDGPTTAAGAFGLPEVRPKMIKIQQDIKEQKKLMVDPEKLRNLEFKLKQLDDMLPENVLKRNDSYTFYSRFDNGKNLVTTGLTGTNVMDLHFIYIKRKNCECNIQALVTNEELVKSDDKSLDECDFLFDQPVDENEQSTDCDCEVCDSEDCVSENK